MYPFICDIVWLTKHKTDLSLEWTNSATLMPSYGTFDFMIGRCTKDVGKNGHGWTFIMREYNDCGQIQIFLSDFFFGEYIND